jgi:hypothetical protein
MRRPEIHCESMPEMVTWPPLGLRGATSIGGHPAVEDSSTPSPLSASSNGKIGRRRKYFCPTTVTGAPARDAKPVRK